MPAETVSKNSTHVAARSVELAVVLNVVVDDVDGTAAVVLNDLIRGVVGTTANDPGLLSGLVVLDGDGILADVLEPDVLNGAVAIAVDALGLVLADDGVLQSTTGTDEEHGVLVTWILL